MPQAAKQVFVPRPPRPIGNAPVSHAFDSNGVRIFGPMDASTWKRFKVNFKAKGYTTAWIPWVAREVAGTNFIRDDGTIVMKKELKEIVRSIKRFDELAEGEVFVEFEQLYKFTLFEYAGDSRGHQFITDNENVILKRIFLAKRVKERLDIGKDGSNRDGSYFLGFKDPEGGWFGDVVRHTFVGHSKKAIAAWKSLITVDENSPDEQIAKDIGRQIPKLALRRGQRLGVPDDVLQVVLDKWNAAGEHPDTMFVYANFLESWYYVEFARGHLTRKRYENDGHDFHIASYLGRAQNFVTGDKNLRTLLNHITKAADTRIIKPPNFIKQVLS
jgi:hypothetical protein